MKENLSYIFTPRTVAVIGASTKKGSIGNIIFANILLNGFSGIVYPVNPNAQSVLGVKSYPSVLDIPDEVDLAVVVVPALVVSSVLSDCGKKGVKAAVIITAGFKEIGEKGLILEEKVKEIARDYNIALLGPNCFGTINTDKSFNLNTTFGRVMPEEGNIAFVTQSGAVGATSLELAVSEGIGLSKFVSFGNKADINENDLLEYLLEDEQTKVILLYLEDLSDPKRFFQVTSKLNKPILAIKAGRTEAGAKAAASHTGALTGSNEAYNAFLDQCGILRVETITELFSYAKALAYQPLPKTNKVAILTNAGGIGVMTADAVVEQKLELASFSQKTKEILKEILPPQANINNPVDVVGDSDEKRYISALKAILADEEVSGVIANWTPSIMAETKVIAQEITKLAPLYNKPIMGCLLTLSNPREVIQLLWQAKIPYYPFTEIAAKALNLMWKLKEQQAKPKREIKIFKDVNKESVNEVIVQARKEGRKEILEPESYKILAAYNIPFLPCYLARNVDEALKKTKEIGYPVVLKISGPSFVHKTDIGGVLVDIETDEELKTKFEELIVNIKKIKPEAEIKGVLVQKMAEKGIETIIGVRKDLSFGNVIMFGIGGIYVEVLKDVSFRVCPINELQAKEMIEEIKSYPILKGVRGRKRSDIEKVVDVLMRVSQLVSDFEEFAEIDINPFVVYEEGKGAFALDARFILS